MLHRRPHPSLQRRPHSIRDGAGGAAWSGAGCGCACAGFAVALPGSEMPGCAMIRLNVGGGPIPGAPEGMSLLGARSRACKVFQSNMQGLAIQCHMHQEIMHQGGQRLCWNWGGRRWWLPQGGERRWLIERRAWDGRRLKPRQENHSRRRLRRRNGRRELDEHGGHSRGWLGR